MSLMQLSGGTFKGVTSADATQAGITHITQASVEKSAGTVVRGKDGQGAVKAVLIGKEIITMSVSGYSTNGEGAALGTEIKVAGLTGKVISASIEATAEDFAKFSAEGRALSPEKDSPAAAF
jgi:hypothetical protein